MTAHRVTARDGCGLHVLDEGPREGPVLAFANSLATDTRLWDGILPLLPQGYRIIRYDMRGHGRSDVPAPPYRMGTLVADAEAVLDAMEVKDCTFIGLSIGGMVAQGLAVKRPDLIGALVLSNTAAKIGTPAQWQDRIDTVADKGLEALADATMLRWFGRDFLAGPDLPLWRARFLETPGDGYRGCCAAIAGTDFYTPTSGLRLPALAIAGTEDKATPPDLVRETADLIPGCEMALIRRAGHLPCVDAAEEYARILSGFLDRTGRLP